MKFAILAAVMVGAEAPVARADDQIFEASVGSGVTTGSQEAPGEAMVLGTVTLSSKGEIKVIWDGLSVRIGSVSIGETGTGHTFASVNLPTMVLDLQKVLGVKWMDAITLSLASGSYDDNPIEGKTDITIGQIGISLTQSVLKTKAVQWTVSEGVTANYFQRQMYESNSVFEAVPVSFTINSKLVARLAPHVVATISMGAFATVVNGINQNEGFRSVVAGAQVTPSVAFGDRWTFGGHLDVAHSDVVAGGSSQATAINASAFVKFLLGRSGNVSHALEVSVATVDDGIVRDIHGNDTRATVFAVKYTVAF